MNAHTLPGFVLMCIGCGVAAYFLLYALTGYAFEIRMRRRRSKIALIELYYLGSDVDHFWIMKTPHGNKIVPPEDFEFELTETCNLMLLNEEFEGKVDVVVTATPDILERIRVRALETPNVQVSLVA